MAEVADLEFVTTEELIKEVVTRHPNIIIIKDLPGNDAIRTSKSALFIKTTLGPTGKPEKGFDLMIATRMLETALREAIKHYLEEGA